MYKKLLIIWILLLVSCTSLKKAKLKEYPQFIKKSEKILVTSPFCHSSSVFSSFIFKDLNQKKKYKIDPDIKKTEVESEILESSESEGTIYTKTKEIAAFNFQVMNTVDSAEYQITGKTSHQ